jgi:flagellar biosynthesis protein FliR
MEAERRNAPDIHYIPGLCRATFRLRTMTIAVLPDVSAFFMLVFARIGTLMMLMPGIGERFILSRAKLVIALFVALMMVPVARPLMSVPATPQGVIGLMVSEAMVGLVLGVSARMVMAALETAGIVIAQQLGLAYAMTVNPAGGQQAPTVGNFLTILGMTLIMVTDLHHVAIAAIYNSYRILPPGGMPDSGDAMMLALKAASQGFLLGVQISAPFIVFGLLFNFGLGILSRMMPQLQVFFLAIPATVLIGMAILMAVLGVMMGAFLEGLGSFLKLMTGS